MDRAVRLRSRPATLAGVGKRRSGVVRNGPPVGRNQAREILWKTHRGDAAEWRCGAVMAASRAETHLADGARGIVRRVVGQSSGMRAAGAMEQ